MARYGGWEDRPWQGRESGRDWDRWRREQQGRGWREEEPWTGRGEYAAGRGREEWREEDRSRWDEEARREWPDWRGPEHRGPEYYEERRRLGGMYDPRWERRWTRRRSDYPEERDRPWVEPSPGRWRRGETRGLIEWEDRGPLAWLRDRFRERERRPRGPKGYTRSDERIEDDVCERVARSGVEGEDIEVKVENREVTLTGTVTSREEKWWLESLVDDVFGVEEVHNHLRVAREPSGRAAQERTERRGLHH